MTDRTIGFVGLGQMGGPMAANIAKGGHSLVCYDVAGTAERAPEGARVADSIQRCHPGCRHSLPVPARRHSPHCGGRTDRSSVGSKDIVCRRSFDRRP